MIRCGVVFVRIITRFTATVIYIDKVVIGQRRNRSFRQQMKRNTILVASESTIGYLVFGANTVARAVGHQSDEKNTAE